MITRYYISFWGCIIISHIVAVLGLVWFVAWVLLAVVCAYLDYKSDKKLTNL